MNRAIKGVKLDPKPTTAQLAQKHDVELQNLQVASRMTQLLLQQLMNSFQGLSKDLGKAYGIINELQYKVLAMQRAGNFSASDLEVFANELRLKDFEEASSAEDVAGGFVPADVVTPESTVIVTSTTTSGEDQGIFRSRIRLAESGVPALVEGLTGKPVGTKVTCTLNGQEHVVELLAIRNPPPAATVPQTDTEVH